MNSLLALLRRLEGPQTIGRGPAFWSLFGFVLVLGMFNALFLGYRWGYENGKKSKEPSDE